MSVADLALGRDVSFWGCRLRVICSLRQGLEGSVLLRNIWDSTKIIRQPQPNKQPTFPQSSYSNSVLQCQLGLLIFDINLAMQQASPLSDETIFWLQTSFQNGIEVSMQLSRMPSPEQTPYDNKYKAIDILRELRQVEHPYRFIVDCVLGEIYADVQQLSDSLKSYTSALKELMKLEAKEARGFANYLIVVYNMLGLSLTNREDNELGLGCLARANQVYEAWQDVPGEDVYHTRSFPVKGRHFRYLYEGGVDHEQMEDSYTLTLFYMAQAYTKMELPELAAQHCGMTLRRQFERKKYEVGEMVANLTGLADYYQGNKNFAQSQYIHLVALRLAPEGESGKQVRAGIHMALGNLLAEVLEFGAQRISNQDVQQTDNVVVSKQVITFEEGGPFPKLILPTNIQQCKSFFRQANTQFKKSMEYFVLDGYVSEHVDILFGQSRLYKALGLLEKSGERRVSMLEKRRELLEPLLKELNPKAFPGTCQRILVEVSEVINDQFNLRVALLGAKGVPNDDKIKASYDLGRRGIKYYKEIVGLLEEDKEATRDKQYYSSIINSKINIAKATSKLLSVNKQHRVGYLKQSLVLYQQILEFVDKRVPGELKGHFAQEVQLTRQMIGMMPSKIDRINYGQLHYID